MEVSNEEILKALETIQYKQSTLESKLDQALERLEKIFELTDRTGDFLGDKLDSLETKIEEIQ